MNARGQENYILYFVLVFIFCLSAGGLLFLFIRNVGDASTYQRLTFAEDMGLTLTALHATGANTAYTYTTPSLNRFSYTITPGEVIVHEGGKQDVSAVYAQDLAEPLITQKEETLLTPKTIHFTREANTISARASQQESHPFYNCPETHKSTRVELVIPPLYKAIADGARHANPQVPITESRITTTADFTIEIAAGKGPLQILIPTEQDYETAYTIACRIANKLGTQEPVIIRPISTTRYPALKGKSGFVIEADQTLHTQATGDTIGRGLL